MPNFRNEYGGDIPSFPRFSFSASHPCSSHFSIFCFSLCIPFLTSSIALLHYFLSFSYPSFSPLTSIPPQIQLEVWGKICASDACGVKIVASPQQVFGCGGDAPMEWAWQFHNACRVVFVALSGFMWAVFVAREISMAPSHSTLRLSASWNLRTLYARWTSYYSVICRITCCALWQALMKEVDKRCSKFCVTVATVTRTAGILIRSRLKVLAVNLSRHPDDFGCMLA